MFWNLDFDPDSYRNGALVVEVLLPIPSTREGS